MNTKSNHMPSDLFDQWQSEDRQLKSYMDELREWMNQVNQLGIPHFGEAGSRLASLRQRLQQHFEREDEIVQSLAAHFVASDATVAALRANSGEDHQLILNRLDSLMKRLHQLEPPFESWLAAMNEIELFVEGLNQHEKDESNYVAAMLIAGESQI